MDIDAIPATRLERDTVRRLSVRSDAKGLARLGAHLGLLAMTGAFIAWSYGTAWLVLAILVHGVVLDFLFCPLHEAVHRTAFQRRWLNDAVAWIAGPLLLLPPGYFRLFHFAHHRFTQDPARDPELAAGKPASLAGLLWHISGLPNWRARLKVTLRHALLGCVPEPFIPPDRHRAIIREARIVWAIYLLIGVGSLVLRSDAALIYWILPAMAGQPFLRLFLLAEHTGCPNIAEMFANTRTTYTNAAVRLLTWNMPFHVEHHAYPSVPFHALPAANRLVRDHIQVAGAGYLRVSRSLIRGVRRR
jgi:fatty acid desaturase